MLPDNLFSVYQHYKKDTNAVASWLASTAKSCGYPSDLLSGGSFQATEPEQTKRLKGKARKEAKAAAAQQQSTSSSYARPDYVIAIKDFIPLAEFIAASKKPVISVPLVFANTLNRVIITRSGFGNRLAGLGQSTDFSADSNHSYFVGVLEKVRDVLKPRFPPACEDVASPNLPSDPSNPVEKIGGRFAGLSVYEPSEEFLNAPDIERPTPVSKDNATYVAESLQDFEEALFAYTLLIQDLSKIRGRIQWIWTTYRDNRLDLAAAAMATNTACDLARNMMEDVEPSFKAHGGAIKVGKKFYMFLCLIRGFSWDDLTKFDNGFNRETYEVANDTYLVPYMLLEEILDNLKLGPPNALPLYGHGSPFTYDPTPDWGTMPNQEKYRQDEILLTEFFTDLMTVVRGVPEYPVHDEFIRGMQELDKTKKVPMYLVFAAQAFLDIHHILRGKVYSAHELCMSHLRLMDEDVALHLDFNATLCAKNRSAINDMAMKEMRKVIKWVQDDPINQVNAEAFSEGGMSFAVPGHRILRYSPVISGLMLYQFRATMYRLGLKLADSTCSILYPMHLYNALQQEKILAPKEVPEESWDDMFVAQGILGRDSFYVGSQLPQNPAEYLKKLGLQLGVTANAFIKSKRSRALNRDNVISKDRYRGIKSDCAPVSDMFFDRYVLNTGQVDWTPEHVERVISRSLYDVAETTQNGKPAMFMKPIMDPDRLRERKKNIAVEATGKRTAAAAGARMAPEKLITNLFLILSAESLTMVFPYLALHRATWGVLREVRKACEPLLLQQHDLSSLKNEDQLPEVVTSIFMAMNRGDDRLFIKAGEAVKEQLRRGEGARAMERLRAMGLDVLTPGREPDPSSP